MYNDRKDIVVGEFDRIPVRICQNKLDCRQMFDYSSAITKIYIFMKEKQGQLY